MLRLRRRSQESVMIGDDIEVRVVGIKGKVVELLFIAPKSVKVDRKEVRMLIEARDAALNVDNVRSRL